MFVCLWSLIRFIHSFVPRFYFLPDRFFILCDFIAFIAFIRSLHNKRENSDEEKNNYGLNKQKISIFVDFLHSFTMNSAKDLNSSCFFSFFPQAIVLLLSSKRVTASLTITITCIMIDSAHFFTNS
jgi:hypothetical protein